MKDPHSSPWKVLKRKVEYRNAWIRLEHHDVITPGKTKGIYGSIYFTNYAIGIIPIDERGNTWLVGQYRYPLSAYSWEIPMGGGPISQPILDSAKRELKEETGLEAHKWTQVMEIHTSNCITDEQGFVFVAQSLKEGPPSFEDTEDIQIRKLPFIEAFQMVMEGQITDSISIAGLLITKLTLF